MKEFWNFVHYRMRLDCIHWILYKYSKSILLSFFSWPINLFHYSNLKCLKVAHTKTFAEKQSNHTEQKPLPRVPLPIENVALINQPFK